MTQTLYRKWRPRNWEQVIGQDHIIQTLRNAVASDRLVHAFLFAGPRGTGKTTTARILAKAANCLDKKLPARPCDRCEHCQALNRGSFLDLIEIDAASNTSVDDVRDLREKINFSPNQGRFKVYVIDEVHMLSTAAFNALLKTLEEPPPHAIFILATTEMHKIPATVLSRCQRHEFRRIPVVEIISQLKRIAAEEKFQVDEATLTLIARQSTGSMRDAISLLDQLASTGKDITLALAEQVLGTVASQAVLDLVEALVAGETAKGLDLIHRTLDAGADPRLFARQVVDHLRNLLMVCTGNAAQIDATVETRTIIARQAQHFGTPMLLQTIRLFNQAANDTRNAWQPSLPLEMAFLEALGICSTDAGGEGGEVKIVQPSQQHGIVSEARKTTDKRRRETAPPSPVIAETPQISSKQEKPGMQTVSVRETTPPYSNDPSPQLGEEQWRQVVSLVGQVSPQMQGLLRKCKPYGIKNNVFFLGFEGDFPKAKMESKINLALIQQVLAQVLGREVGVHCFVAGQRGALPGDVESDGLVASALRDLGGEIVDIQ